MSERPRKADERHLVGIRPEPTAQSPNERPRARRQVTSKHLTDPLSAQEIRDAIGVTDEDLEFARRAIGQTTDNKSVEMKLTEEYPVIQGITHDGAYGEIQDKVALLEAIAEAAEELFANSGIVGLEVVLDYDAWDKTECALAAAREAGIQW